MEKPTYHPKIVREFFFWTGIVATIAYRILNFIPSPLWAKIAWYIGTIGFVIYFIHRYQISEKRAKLIKQHKLLEKIKSFEKEDQEASKYIFETLMSTKEKWNYIVIFAVSGVALAISLYLDFFHK